jgi:thiamine biosynthesis lipoprotein
MRFLTLLLVVWCGAGAAGELVRVEKSAEAMGSTFGVVLYGRDRAMLEGAADAALSEAQRLDRMLSNYLPDSEWSEVNRDAAIRPVKLSGELFQLLSDCMKYSRESGGAFDIAVGPLMKVWGFYRGEGRLPQQAEVRGALALTGYRHVLLDAAALSVQFDRAGVELDPGGIGKGYAVDRMVEVLKGHGVEIALVSAGGSSTYGLGAPPEEPQGWRVAIRSPKASKQTAAVVFLKDESLSTSGGYEKFFWAAGRRYSHIMDPRTGYPATGASAVSVIAPRTIDSEVWAKPYFINGRAWTAAHKPGDFRVLFCDDTKEQVCSWVR